MTPIEAMLVLSKFLSCYALVLTVAWFRAVGALDRRQHIGHFVALMGVFVPGVALTVLVFFVAAVLGIPAIVPLLALILPGAIVIGLQAELSHLAASGPARDAERLGIAVALTLAFIALG